MIKIAIVEDQEEDYKILEQYITQYGKEKQQLMQVRHFSNGLNFLDEYTPEYQIVFMDVEMPHLDGIETARKLRNMDNSVALVFVTNMIQYAINGYEVNAIDFMVKPVGCYNFYKKLDKALVFAQRNQKKHMVFRRDDTDVIVPVQFISYVEKDKNYAIFHTQKGDFRMRTTIADMEEELLSHDFFKCCSSCLVNLAYVGEIKNDSIRVGEVLLPLARRQKKEFLLRLTQYIGGTGK